jgi:membrane protease YdiL (CAAX protease family)
MKALVVGAPLISFFVLAFSLSWVVTIPMVLLHGPPQWMVLATFAPTIAALAVSRTATGSFKFWTSPASWTGWTRLVGGALAGAALVIIAYVVLPGIFTADPKRLNWSILLSLQVFNYSTLLGGPIGEEIGWTGYALQPMLKRFGPLRGSLFLGVLWALWHLPLFPRPGFFSTPFWIYIIMMVGLRLIITACANWSGFSIAVAIVTHAAFNTVSRWLGGLYKDVQPQSSLPFELVMALGGLTIASIVVLATRGRLAYPPDRRIFTVSRAIARD